MSDLDWDGFEIEELAGELRRHAPGPDAEKMIYAFEQAVAIARVDEELLSYVLAAVTCLIARMDDVTPRDVLETFFRRSITDQEWRDRYLPLFD
ncbi:MAG TPA: hypothetical protein VE615_11545 [Gaiellaceae bacterium]|jgi:hypothetical protein|nr:hypothetical protein [Gaiellaceae bacterium]